MTLTRDDQEFLLEVGDMLRSARKDAGLSQETLAEQCKMSACHLHNIEHGRHNAGCATLAHIAACLGMNLQLSLGRRESSVAKCATDIASIPEFDRAMRGIVGTPKGEKDAN